MRHFPKISAAVLFLAIAVLVGRQVLARNQTPDQYNPKKDKIVKPEVKDITNAITLTGSVAATDIAQVRFQTAGKLAWIGARVGDRVKKGQAIASLDKNQLRKDLDKELNDYKAALHTFNDTQDEYKETKERYLLTDGIKRLLDRSQYTLNNAVLDYELSELTLKLATIYSPINGIVTASDQPVAGVNVSPTSATFTIVDPKSVYFKSEIDQETVTNIKIGQPATLKLDSFPDQSLDSKISYISFTPIAGESSTVYEVRFKLSVDNSNLTYRLGMDGDAHLVLSQEQHALTIPTDAVFIEENEKFVYLLTDQKLKHQKIKTGIETDFDTQVLEGLSPNDQVVQKL